MTKSEAARLNGKRGGRPRKAPATVLGGDGSAPVPTPEVVATAPEAPANVVPALDNPFDLNPRQLLFVEAYFGAANFSASEAYRLAGYEGVPESVSANAARLIGSDRVQKAVQARLATLARRLGPVMDGDEALARISTVARADIRKLLHPDDPLAKVTDEVAATIKSIIPGRYGRRVELHDSLRASELMAKVAGKLKETIKVEFTLEQILAQANKPAELSQGTAA